MNSTTKKINFLDFLLILTILFSITGYILARAEKTGLNKVIQVKEKVAIELLLNDIYSEHNNLFKTGDEAALTIRNRPYGKLKIIKFEIKPKQIVIPNLSGSYKTIPDPTRTNIKDYLVIVVDTALKTSDGYVFSGNKIKIGNPIELEGFNYRLNGKIVNLYPYQEILNGK